MNNRFLDLIIPEINVELLLKSIIITKIILYNIRQLRVLDLGTAARLAAKPISVSGHPELSGVLTVFIFWW